MKISFIITAMLAIFCAKTAYSKSTLAPLGDILRNADMIRVGIAPSTSKPSLVYLTDFEGANAACDALGERLTNIHELAAAMNPGATSETQKAGYNKISYLNDAGQTEIFY